MTVPEPSTLPASSSSTSLDTEIAKAAAGPRLWNHTPLLESARLSKQLGCRVLFKMEMFQPAGSFKSRGIGNLCRTAMEEMKNKHGAEPKDVMLFCSSGGNAGLAAVTAARALSSNATVILPTTTPTSTIDKVAELGGIPIVHGHNWFEADAHARSLVAAAPLGFYIPPFDHPSIWRGHATLVDELVDDLSGSLPDVVIASVGGGGLLCGILQGLEEHGATTSTAIAVETTGTAKLAKSLKADEVVVLKDVSGIATTLGCSNVCDGLWDGVKRWKDAVKSWVATDTQAARACVRFADEERCIVEAACGAALAAVYEPDILKSLMEGRKPLTRDSIVVVVVCGGNNANVDVLANYRKTYC